MESSFFFFFVAQLMEITDGLMKIVLTGDPYKVGP